MENVRNIEQIKWKKEYNIGFLSIDKEHQFLFNIARKALGVSLKKENIKPEELKTIIKELTLYVKSHFSNEESYMRKIGYPELDNHKILHKMLINLLNNLIKNINNLEFEEIKEELFKFIEEYFVNHIILEDKKIQIWSISLDELRKNFGWKDVYSVNNVQIDKEHQELFNIAKEAFCIVDSSKRNEKIKIILNRLITYMKTHFEYEEEFMKENDYIRYEEHKKIHKNIIEKLNDFIKKLPHMNIELFEKELARIIDITLVQHIIQEDRKIVAWLNTKP
ncbi:bacteriohemerythrin [Malaciobacter mytili]|uniref:Hemerythrin-like domain-containing protein n=1 Tax=Malaciobacter mytili LMG 24559 TaxID=1032238 RepID=A0AAX2AFD2_9BACT|nr:bacteriohemerythrin [Malaciobacter mytili]AXH16257.1 hemerythrin (two domain) [Malaciobacter mytili LMG 24559]RXK13770.1 hypothetical protein CP985_12545 [Malaciobacter mytili LMG 24559]